MDGSGPAVFLASESRHGIAVFLRAPAAGIRDGDDDGSDRAREQADRFWSCLTQRVYGSLALAALGDLSEFPVFIELLRHQPAGHLTELAAEVLRHYVDPRRELDTPHLIQRAEEWFSSTGEMRADE